MRSDLREDYFSSQVKEILPVLMKKPGQMELEAAAHTVYSEEAEERVPGLSSLSPLYSAQDPQPVGWCCPKLGWVLPPSLI